MENEDYIKKWLQGILTEGERGLFEQTEEYRSLEKLSKSLLSLKAPEYDASAEYERLRPKLSSRARPSTGKVVAMNWLSPLLKIAASLVLMAGGYFLFRNDSPTVVKTLAGEKTTVTLPDSSFVALNSFSRLSFYEKKWKQERKVELDGEAFFKVAKGSRFDVVTSSGTISVLGTEFNVRNRKDFFEVICYEGSVEVQSAKESVKLFPKQLFRIMSDVVSKDRLETGNALGWRDNESSFKSVPFLYVVKEFERQYDVSVTVSRVDTNQLFTGSFTHSDLSLALKSITIPLDLTYRIAEDKKIVLTGDSK